MLVTTESSKTVHLASGPLVPIDITIDNGTPVPRPAYTKSDLQSQTILMIVGITLLILAVVVCLVITIACLYKRRKKLERKKLKLNNGDRLDIEKKEMNPMKGIHSDLVDVLFNRGDGKTSRKSSLKKETPAKKQCQVCLDRGNTACKGHSKRRSKSASLKSRKDLNFIEHGGYYEHVKVQTDTLSVPDVHIYTKLDTVDPITSVPTTEIVGLVAPSQPTPPVNTQAPSLDSELQYNKLSEAYSGSPSWTGTKNQIDDNSNGEYEYSVAEEVNHYEELPQF